MGFVFFSTYVEACFSMAACNNLDLLRGQKIILYPIIYILVSGFKSWTG